MPKKSRNYIDKMVEIFGYDYVIGYCLCSEYDLRGRAEREHDEEKRKSMNKIANKYSNKCEQLMAERFNNGL